MDKLTPTSLQVFHGIATLPAARLTDGWVAWFVRVSGKLAKALQAEWRVRNAMRELERYDDHLLADIGVDRACIEHHVRCGRSRVRAP